MNTNGLSDEILNDTSGFPDDSAPAPKEEKVVEVLEPEEGVTPEPEGDEGGELEARSEKPRKSVQARMDEVIRQRNEEREARRALEARLAALEAVQPRHETRQTMPEDAAPDPTKYEYGALDDNYINDMIAYQANKIVQDQLSRNAQQMQVSHQATVKMTKAREIVDKGVKVHDDFEEVVFNGGMRGDYRLEEPTFDALSEAENPHEIIYELANNPREAARVASMTPTQQARYVFMKDAEFSAKSKDVRAPKAQTPPGQATRGQSGRFTVAGDTDDLDAFEKEFFAKKR